MSSAITLAGQTRINELRGAEQPLVIDRMVLAMVPGLDPTQPVDRNQQMPDPTHIVHTYDIPAEFKGYVDPDQVVYSMILGSDVGDFSFNWVGTVEAVTGNVISVTTTPETPKRKTNLVTNTTGNNVTRNVMMQFQDAQALTGVTISAETWQFDYTTLLVAKIEEHNQDGGAHQDIRQALTEKTAIASQAEVNTGEIANKMIVPARLKAWWDSVRTWNNIKDKPSTFPPLSHNHTPDQVGLSNLPNAKSDSVTSSSSAILATAKAAKIAYDKGVSALNTANAKALKGSLYNAATGYWKDNNTGFMVQWGSLTIAQDVSVNVSFPAAFPSRCGSFQIVGSLDHADYTNGVRVRGVYRTYAAVTTRSKAQTWWWIAVGC